MPLLKSWTEDGAQWGIWQVTESIEELQALLQHDYTQQLGLIHAPTRKMEYIGVRVLLKALLGKEVEIAHHPSGKPYLPDKEVHITLSHTKGYIAAGICRQYEVGMDIEYRAERVRKVVSRFLRPDEMPYRHSLSPEAELNGLLLHWSAKETLFKLVAEGEVDFIHDLRILPFPIEEEGVMRCETYCTRLPQCFRIHYVVRPAFVCTWGVDENLSV